MPDLKKLHIWWSPHNGLFNVTNLPQVELVGDVTINYEALVDDRFTILGSTGVQNSKVDALFKRFQAKALSILRKEGGRAS